MKIMYIRNSDQALSLKEIKDAEKELGLTFPEGYKEFLLLHNGGQPEQKSYDFAENDNGSDVHCFLSINGDDSTSLLNEAYFFQDRIPKEFIPIAYDSGSNKICLGVREPYYNQVYFWDFNEEGPLDGLPTFDNMYLLAHSFEEFINKLFKVELRMTEDNNRLWIYTHDHYSLPLSLEVRQYGATVLDFFSAAPEEVIDFVMEQPGSKDVLRLWYEDVSGQKIHERVIHSDGRVVDSTRSSLAD